MTDIRQALSRERTRTIAGAAVVAALVAVIIAQSWSGLPVTGSAPGRARPATSPPC